MMRMMLALAAAGALAACGAVDASPRAAPGANLAASDTFEFVLHRTDSAVVDSIFVMRAGRRVQTLVPSQLLFPGFDPDLFRLDLDFDGHQDLAFLTMVPAGPNALYDYWRLDPAADRFRYVGEYEMFDPDSATRTLFTHARGGHAGRLWSSSRWRWMDDAPVEVWRGEQTWADDVQRYVYVESELRDGRLVVVRADTLENCEADPVDDPECEQAAAGPTGTTAAVPALPRHGFTLYEDRAGAVDSIGVTVDGRPAQTLWPRANRVSSSPAAERLSSIDLDFDGHADLALLSTIDHATGSSRSEYWRHDPRTGRFAVAGDYPTLAPDSAARELTSFTRGGPDDRVWSAARWRWAGDVMVPVVEEEEFWRADLNLSVQVVCRRGVDVAAEVRCDTRRVPEPRAGPSWMAP